MDYILDWKPYLLMTEHGIICIFYSDVGTLVLTYFYQE